MTEPTDFSSRDDLLPGLAPPGARESLLQRAVRRSIVQLEAVGVVDERHAMHCQLMLDLAEVVDSGRRQGKASAAAMAAAQLLAAYAQVVPEVNGGGDGDEEWNELVAEIRRSAAAPRNST